MGQITHTLVGSLARWAPVTSFVQEESLCSSPVHNVLLFFLHLFHGNLEENQANYVSEFKDKFLLDIRISKKGQIWSLIKCCLYYSFLKNPGFIHSGDSNLVLKNTSSSEKRYFM